MNLIFDNNPNIKITKKDLKKLFEFAASETLILLEFCEISKNTFSYRTPPVAAFVDAIKFFDYLNSRLPNIKVTFESKTVVS